MERSKYLVDLCEFDCNAQCSCEAFQFSLQPIAERRMQMTEKHRRYLIETSPQRCSHIMRARRYLLDEIIRKTCANRKES